MLLKHTLLYLPAQFVGPLFQLLAMIVWTHVVDEHTLGVITLITATHELLQIGFLAWWSQYALRFLGRYQEASDAPRFYRTENAVLLASIMLQSAVVIGILLLDNFVHVLPGRMWNYWPVSSFRTDPRFAAVLKKLGVQLAPDLPQ